MQKAQALECDDHGRPVLVETHIHAIVANVTLWLRFDYFEPTGMRWTRERGDLKSLSGAWRLEDRGGGRTRATYSLEIGLNRTSDFCARGCVDLPRQRSENSLRITQSRASSAKQSVKRTTAPELGETATTECRSLARKKKPASLRREDRWRMACKRPIRPDLGPIPEGLCRPALNLLIGRPCAIRSGGSHGTDQSR